MKKNKLLLGKKIQALNIQPGDRIVAYFKNKMQICTDWFGTLARGKFSGEFESVSISN